MSHAITLASDTTVREVQSVGGDHMVVAAAKVSTCGEEALRFADPALANNNAGLINYLMKHRHGTPFEHSALTCFIHTPALVWWQWVRHRIAHSFSIESGRYGPMEPVFWVPRRNDPIVPVDGWKPGRPKFLTLDESEYQSGRHQQEGEIIAAADRRYEREVERKRRAYQVAYDAYMESLEDGISLEVARATLGFAIYYTGWVTTNPRSIMSFLSLRTHDENATFPSYPQYNIEEPARAIEAIFAKHWPLTHKAFVKNGRVAP